jgi:hypothetical protein
MTNELLERNFKTLLYDFGEINWSILTDDAWSRFINKDEPFNEKQLENLRQFVNDLLEELKDEPKP